MRLLLLAFTIVSAALAVQTASAELRPLVATSIPPQRYFLKRLLGEDAEIILAIPPGADHEHFEPGIAELEKLSRAEVYVLLDHPKADFERQWVARISELRDRKKPLVTVASLSGINVDSTDMHYWLSPRIVRESISVIGLALQRAYPSLSPELARRSAELILEIGNVEKELQSVWKQSTHCSFLTYHSSWSYFARDFGLRELSFEEDGKEPGMMKVMKSLSAAKKLGIRTIFIEPQFPSDSVRAFQEELQADLKVLDPMAENWSENIRRASKLLFESCPGQDTTPESAAKNTSSVTDQ